MSETTPPNPKILGWPSPPFDAYCHRYNTEVRRRPGFFDPPDIYGTPMRAERIAREYPEIHEWADAIARDWHRRRFLGLTPPQRARVVACMMFVGRDDGNRRIAGIDGYLLALRARAGERAIEWMRSILAGLASLLPILTAGLPGPKRAAEEAGVLLGELGELALTMGEIAQRVEAGEIEDMEAAAEIAAELADTIGNIGKSMSEAELLAVAEKVRRGLDLARALAQVAHAGPLD